MSEKPKTRTIVKCIECKGVYVAECWPDGKIRTIGRAGCQCGQNAFVEIEDPTSVDPDD